MKFMLLSVLLFFCSVISFSQQISLKGKFIFDRAESIDLVEVLLSKQDSIVSTAMIGEDGIFIFTHLFEGSYTLEVKQWGEVVYNKVLDLKKDTDLDSIKIDSSKEIQSVIITGKKKLIERKVDRLVFNVENSVFSSGGDIIDVLRKTPQIRVKEESLSMIGKSIVKVMVNNRILSLSGKELIAYLQSISSDEVKNIEVITNPPSQYSAEGNSGLININLKKAYKDTWGLFLRQRYKQASYPTNGSGLSFNFNKNKIILSSNINYSKGKTKNFNHIKYFYPDEPWYILDENVQNENFFSGRIGIDYLISKKNTLGLVYDYVQSKSELKGDLLTKIKNRSDYDLIQSLSNITNDNIYHSINLHDTYMIDSTGKQLMVDFDYFYNKNPKDNYSHTYYSLDGYKGSDYYIQNVGKQKIDNFSFNINMQYPFSWIELNYGVKVSFNKTKNNISYYDLTSGEALLDLNNTDKFYYKENNQAFYFTANKKINDKWELKLGLRTELTQTEGKSFTLDQADRKKYSNLFPTAYLMYVLKDDASISINYGRRIQRPRFYSLNPFRFYSNPYSYTTGNPDLHPSYSHNLELTYMHKDFVHTFYYSKIEGDYEQITILSDSNRTQINQPLNALNSDIVGYKASYSFSRIGWWESMNECNVSYAEYKSPFSFISNRRNIGWSFYFSTDNTFYLNKSKTIALNMSWWYNSKGPDQMDEGTSYNNLDIAFKLFLMEKNLQITFQGRDITGSNRPKWTSFTNNVKQIYKNYGDWNQYFLLSVVYKLGNKKLKESKRQTSNEEEKERIK